MGKKKSNNTANKKKTRDYFKSFNLKGPNEVTPSQLKRYRKYIDKHPDGTLIAAGGHKSDIEPKDIYKTDNHGNIIYRNGYAVKDIAAMNEQAYRYAWSQLGLKVAVGAMSKEEAIKEFNMLKAHKDTVKTLNTLSPTSPDVDWFKIGLQNQTRALKNKGYLMNRNELLNIIYYHT